METLQIRQIFDANKVIYKLFEQQSKFPISIGFKIFKISKIFDEVEEYVFNIMEMTFENFNFMNMTEEQKKLFEKILNEQIELDFQKINTKYFENNEDVMLNIEEIANLSIILEENKQ